ncbi:MAG: M1 family metallopeptidase, partial [Bacteroidetes bacterium]|nr:M1 family metallopeptidase [Bacteroidota bacterium]
MKKVILFFLVFLLSTASIAQTYWQQEVNYKINVSLDDENHFLRGFESMEYINNSPNVIEKLYIHLWPNAYRNRHS